MSNLEVELRWFDAEEMCDPLALRDFFAGEHFVPRAVVYLRAVRAVLVLDGDPEGSPPHLRNETLRDARHAAQAILHDIEGLLPHAVRGDADDLPRPRGAGSLNPEERRRLADALIRSVAFASGDAWLREFITLLEPEIVPVPDDPAELRDVAQRDPIDHEPGAARTSVDR